LPPSSGFVSSGLLTEATPNTEALMGGDGEV